MGTHRQKKYAQIDCFSSTDEFLVFNPSIDNLCRAINERLFYVKMDGKFQRPITPDQRHMSWLSDFVNENFVPSHTYSPYPREHFPKLYEGRKRTIYQNAVDSLRGERLTAKDYVLQAFGKIENLKATGKKREDIVQRVIQTRGPRYNVELGRFLKRSEHTFYDDIDDMFRRLGQALPNEKTILKGLNAIQVAKQIELKWNRFKQPVAVLFDAKRFDQHVNVPILKIEHNMHLQYFPIKRHKRKLTKLLSAQLDNRGRGFCKDGKVKYHIGACRCSGDMNTGSGNCACMCVMVLGLMRSIGINEYAVGNNGDDCFVILEKQHLDSLMNNIDSYFRKCGFVMEVEEPVYHIEGINFCQTSPVFDGSKYRMVRTPRAAMTKDSISIHPFDTVHNFYTYLDSIGQGGLSLTGGIPLMQEYYAAFNRNAATIGRQYGCRRKQRINQVTEINGFWFMKRNMCEKYTTITDDARLSFYRAFDILPDVQQYLESSLRQYTLTWHGKDYVRRGQVLAY